MGWKAIKAGVICVTAALALSLGLAAPAQAEDAHQQFRVDFVVSQVSAVSGEDQLARDIAAAQNHFDTATKTFDYSGAVSSGVSAEFATDFARGVVAAGGSAVGLSGGQVAATALQARCVGVNALWTDWVGNHLQLNSCNAAAFLAMLQGGAITTGAIAAFLTAIGIGAPAAAVLWLVTAFQGYGILWVGACSSYGTGITINLNPGIPPWCWAQ